MKKLKVFVVVILMSLVICVFNVLAQRSVDEAVEWAKEQVGSVRNISLECSQDHPWAYWCGRFVGHAFNLCNFGFSSSWVAWNSPVGTLGPVHLPSETNPVFIPAGALVFFDTTVPEEHVGLCIGNGKVIHAWTDEVRRENIEDVPGTYLGWRWPDGWTDDTNCSDLEAEYLSFFQSQGIYQCLDVEFNSPNEYIVWHYVYNGMFGYWGPEAIYFTSTNPPTVLGWSIVEEDPSVTPNPYTQSTDIHITHCKIRPYKEGSWHHEVDVDMAPGQTFFFELEGRVRNKSNYDLEDVDIDYCFVKDDKDFDVQTRRRIDDDQVDIDEAEKESKHTRRSRVVIASDLSQITVSTDGGHSFNLPITQENLVSEEITLYFYLDVETEDGEDRDVSSESKTDEYAKLEIHLNLPQPPPPDLNLSVPFDQEYIRDKTKNVFTGQAIEIPIQINKSGSDYLASNPFVALDLYGPEFGTPQTLSLYSASNLNLNNSGEDFLTIQIDPISIPGDYYLNVCIDPQEYIVETNEEDNCNLINFVVKRRKNLTPIINLFLNSN